MAAQLTQGWEELVWGRVVRMLAGGPALVSEEPATRGERRRQTQIRLNEGQVQRLVTDYQAGASIAALTRRYGVRHETVALHLKKANVTLRPLPVGIPHDKLTEAHTLRAKGWSYNRIGAHYGCSDTAARKTLLNRVPPTD